MEENKGSKLNTKKRPKGKKRWLGFKPRSKLLSAKSDTDVREKKCISIVRNPSMISPSKIATIKRRYPADPLPIPKHSISAGNLCDVGIVNSDRRFKEFQCNIDCRPAMPLPRNDHTQKYTESKTLPRNPPRPPPIPPRVPIPPTSYQTRADIDSENRYSSSTDSYEVMSAKGNADLDNDTDLEDTYMAAENYAYPVGGYCLNPGRFCWAHKYGSGMHDVKTTPSSRYYEKITSGLSIDQLIESMKSLKLNVACEKNIINQGIDGALLIDMSMKLIQESLEVSELDALKIYKFAHKGWKPLYSQTSVENRKEDI
ncbi:uncharacterized protein LOC117121692 [Anneissia japonica]|uniref:uncharacterized protein LOC117121692 n=1 Tax=Anneissia japonica TaxID=1529436 RepID=UPI001425546A|nr:uncharacterized protein LOC117121692 [Anneissia japonica]